MSSTKDDAWLGQVIEDRYRIEAKIGSGGFAHVFRAANLQTRQPLAVKLMRPGLVPELNAVKRFFREARVSSRLTHPNTLRVYGCGETDDGALYMAMELLIGRPLANVLDDVGFLSPDRVVRIARQICGSLAEAHHQGLVHRDLKPANVFLLESDDPGDRVKVLDFGIAKPMATDEETLTKTGSVLGTPSYMSPEQAAGVRDELDGRSDLYSLGVMMYRMLSGWPPFTDASPYRILLRHMHEEPVDICERSNLPQPIPKEVGAVVMRLLEKEPQARYRTAEELGAALDALIAAGPLMTSGELHATQPTVSAPEAATVQLDPDDAYKRLSASAPPAVSSSAAATKLLDAGGADDAPTLALDTADEGSRPRHLSRTDRQRARSKREDAEPVSTGPFDRPLRWLVGLLVLTALGLAAAKWVFGVL